MRNDIENKLVGDYEVFVGRFWHIFLHIRDPPR